MNQDMCVRCGDGVINIRVGAIIINDWQDLWDEDGTDALWEK